MRPFIIHTAFRHSGQGGEGLKLGGFDGDSLELWLRTANAVGYGVVPNNIFPPTGGTSTRG